MDNSTQHELMRYIDGEMKDDERTEFEKRMLKDEELRQSMDKLHLAKEAVKQYAVKEKVSGIHGQMMKELKKVAPVKSVSKLRRITRYTTAVAASILLMVVLVEGYRFYSLSPEKLFAESYTAYELTTIRDGSQSTSGIEKAYREKKYNEVIKLNANSVLSIKDIFLTGMAYLETMDYARAVSSFQVVIVDVKDNKSSLRDAAEYYLALAYLQNRDYDQAIELMNVIHDNSSHLYKNKFSRNYINRVKRLKWR